MHIRGEPVKNGDGYSQGHRYMSSEGSFVVPPLSPVCAVHASGETLDQCLIGSDDGDAYGVVSRFPFRRHHFGARSQ